MSQVHARKIPWFIWPFAKLWSMLTAIIRLTGRLLGVILALVVMAIGIVLSVTLIAAPVGIPLIILGFLLMLRSVF